MTLNFYLFTIILIIKLHSGVFCSDSLQLVHVVFRHGHRTPIQNVPLAEDPIANETYFPYGLGGLTNEGKTTCYELGAFLKKRYGQLLGNIYQPELIDAVSSASSRTSMSLAVVLAGLFPPKNTLLEWNKNLNWQPTVYRELSPNDKLLMSPFNNNCTTYHQLFKEYLRTEEGSNILKSYAGIYEYIQKKSPTNLAPLQLILGTFDTILARKEINLEIPSWSKDLIYQRDGNPLVDFLLMSSATPELMQLTGGFLLKKILQDTQLKLNNKLNPTTRKMFLYSAHDNTIFYILRAMKVLISRAPRYASCVLVEVHTINNVNSIRILYRDDKDLKTFIVSGCTEFCPFPKFFQLVRKNIPNDALCKSDPECC